jgi:hypothetical protein
LSRDPGIISITGFLNGYEVVYLEIVQMISNPVPPTCNGDCGLSTLSTVAFHHPHNSESDVEARDDLSEISAI